MSQRHNTKAPRASEHESQLDLEVLLNLLMARRTTILMALLVTIGATALFTLISPRSYEASVKLMAEPRRDTGAFGTEIRSYQERKVFLETVKEILVSDSVLRRTVARLEKRAEDTVTSRDTQRLSGQILLQSRSSLTRSLIGGDGIGETNTFFVTVRNGNPKRAAETVDVLVAAFLELNQELRLRQIQDATQALRASVEETTRQVKEAHAALVAFEAEAGPLLPELMNIDKASVRVFPELESLRSDFEAGEILLAERREQAEILREAFEEAGEDEMPILPEFALNGMPTLRSLSDRITELAIKANTLLPFYLEESREVQNVRTEIRLTREEMLRQASALVASELQAVRTLEAAQQARRRSLDNYEAKLTRLSELNSTYQELKRDYNAKARALDSQIQTLAVADSSAAEQLGGHAAITVIDPATANDLPVFPRPLQNMTIALFVGLLLGLLAVIAGHYTRPVFIHPRQVEQATGLPVVGVLSEETK